MLKGFCVTTGLTTTLVKGQQYYLFQKGQNHYLVSKFPNENAHMGCYGLEHFQLEEKEQWPEEPAVGEIILDSEKLFKARLIWRKQFYSKEIGADYYLKPGKTMAFFFKDQACIQFCGCFPLHWFSGFEEVEGQPITEDIELKLTENDLIIYDTVHKIPVFEQLSLF